MMTTPNQPPSSGLGEILDDGLQDQLSAGLISLLSHFDSLPVQEQCGMLALICGIWLRSMDSQKPLPSLAWSEAFTELGTIFTHCLSSAESHAQLCEIAGSEDTASLE